MGYPILREKTYSTVQVAKILDVSWSTLHRWITSKKIRAPRLQLLGDVQVRLWTDNDVEIAMKYKAEHYWEKPGRRKKAKVKH
jgi:excisionase family DNA binding protein